MLQQQKMMKQKTQSKLTQEKVYVVDGPPIDFSFKNIRNIQQLVTLNSTSPNEKVEQIPKNQLFVPKSSQKQIGQSSHEARLNIVRTIELDDSKKDMVKQFVNKKAEKVTSKAVHKTEQKTTSLFLRYNKLRELGGFVEVIQQLVPGNKWEQLIWIDLSHNRLTSISKELQCFPQLKNLYLHVNFIWQFKQFENLQNCKHLRTFTIHGNPIENYPEFRCLLLGILPQLQKIDSALLTKRQKQRGQVLSKQGGKYPTISNPQKPPEESEEEDQG